MPTIIDLGKQIKQQYPTYASMSDEEVGRKVKAKNPVKYASFSDISSATSADSDIWGDNVKVEQPQQKESFVDKLKNPKTYLESFKKTQKTFGELSGVRPFARELARPFVSVASGIQGLIPGGKTGKESVDAPLIGEVKPYSELGKLETAESMLNASFVLPLLKNAGKAPKISMALKNSAIKLYETVLKPSKSIIKKSPGVIETGLKEGINITRGGQTKVRALIETLDDKVDTLIEEGAAAGKKVDVMKLSDYITDLKNFYKEGFGSEEIIKDIDKYAIDYVAPKLKKYGRYIPVEEAQKIKQGTYKLTQKFYNKLAPVAEEVKKTLARGIKDDIANQIKDIGDINTREKTLIELKPAIDDAINRLSKNNILGLRDMIVVGGDLMSQKGIIGIPTLIWKTISSPYTKSTLAIKLAKLSEMAAKDMRVGKTATARISAEIIDYFNKLNE